jgi:hypothetical protein
MRQILLDKKEVIDAIEGFINEVFCTGGSHVVDDWELQDGGIRVMLHVKPKTPIQAPGQPTGKVK